jgi:hypothetical protein
MYSIVNNATSVVSKPNQTAFEILRKVGTVSRTVTRAEMMINDVMNTCMTKAEGEEVGCSRRAWRSCFHRGPDTVSGASKVTLALRLWKISSTSWISSLVGAAPRRRERGIGDDSDMPFDCGVAACHTVREANQVRIGGPIARP